MGSFCNFPFLGGCPRGGVLFAWERGEEEGFDNIFFGVLKEIIEDGGRQLDSESVS